MKNIKKILALLLALCMVFALCACGGDDADDGKDGDKGDKVNTSDKGSGKDKDKDDDKDNDKELSAEELIVGDWEADISMLTMLELMGFDDLDELAEYFDFDTDCYVMGYSFDKNGNYKLSMTGDTNKIEKVFRDGIIALLSSELDTSIADAAAEEGMTEDELIDALVEELFGDVDNWAYFFNNLEGTYEIDGNKLILDGDEDEYDTFEVDEDELTFTAGYSYGEKDDSSLYPITFERA